MSGTETASVMRRMLAPPIPVKADVPLTASRAVRLAMTRAAEEAIGLSISVEGIAEETSSLDELVRSLAPEYGLVQLTRPGDGPPSQDDLLVGVAALDPQFANAVLELQTMGRLETDPPEERPLTSADLALSHPFLIRFFAEMAETTARTALEGWTANINIGGRIENPRAAGLSLPDVNYRVMRIGLDLGSAERQGEIWIALPSPKSPAIDTNAPAQQENWTERLEEAVMASPAALRAVLHRFDMSLATADALREGQVIALAGCTVGSVQLEGPTGEMIAKARLGQVAGHIAVRIEQPQVEMMEALGSGRAMAPISPGLIGSSPTASEAAADFSEAQEMTTGGLIDAGPMTDGALSSADMADPMLEASPIPDAGSTDPSLDLGMVDAAPMEGNMMDAVPIDRPLAETTPSAGNGTDDLGVPMSTGNFGLTDEDEGQG